MSGGLAGVPLRLAEVLAIDDKAGPFGHTIIEPLGPRIRLVGRPVGPRGPRRPGAVIDSGDEGPGDTAPASVLAREQILQIADRAEHRRVSVEEVVHDTDDPAAALRHETMDRLV